jgi:hypothetical protein
MTPLDLHIDEWLRGKQDEHLEFKEARKYRFFEHVGPERLASFDTHDFLARGKVVLSHRLYPFSGPGAAATRKRDAARDQNKAALLRHVIEHNDAGVAMDALLAVVPSLSRSSVKRLLDELRREGGVHPVGTKRNVLWFSGPEPGFGSASRLDDPK